MLFQEKVISGWGKYPPSVSNIGNARGLEDLTESLQNVHVIPRGLGRSYGDQATNQAHHAVLMGGLNNLIDFDAETGLLTCESGVSLEKIIAVFAPKGWFPMINPGTKFVTLGGAIANDIHGKAHHADGSFVNCVKEFSILLADGRLIICSREENSDLFYACFGGLGLLGIITHVKMYLRRIETTYYKQKAINIQSLEQLLDAFEEYDAQYTYSVAWVNPLAKGKSLGKGVLTLGNAAGLEDLPPALKKVPLLTSKPSKLFVPFDLPDFTLNKLSMQFLNMAINYTQASAKEYVHYEKFFFPLDAINEWNRGYGKRGFIQYQFVVPLENGRENIRKLLVKITDSKCTPFLNVLKKFGKGSKYLSFPFEGYTFAIDFPVTKELSSFTRELDQMVLDAGGRIYLGKDAMLDAAMFRAMYPQWEEWMAIKSKYDPTGKFSSDLSRRLKIC